MFYLEEEEIREDLVQEEVDSEEEEGEVCSTLSLSLSYRTFLSLCNRFPSCSVGVSLYQQ